MTNCWIRSTFSVAIFVVALAATVVPSQELAPASEVELKRLIRSENSEDRLQALRQLLKTDSHFATFENDARGLLKDQDNYVRASAALLFAKRRDSSVGPVVLDVLKGDRGGENAAARAVVELRHDKELAAKAIATLVDVCNSGSSRSRIGLMALGELGELASPAADAVYEIILKGDRLDPVKWHLGYLCLERMGPKSVPQLLKLLDASDGDRQLALQTLASLGNGAEPAIPAVRALLKSDSRHIRTLASECLSAIQSKRK